MAKKLHTGIQRTPAQKVFRVIQYIVCIFLAILSLFPFVIMLVNATRSTFEIQQHAISLIPSTFLVESLTPPTLAFFDGTEPVWTGLSFSLREVKPHA